MPAKMPTFTIYIRSTENVPSLHIQDFIIKKYYWETSCLITFRNLSVYAWQFIRFKSVRSDRGKRIPKGKKYYSGKINYVISQFHIIIILSWVSCRWQDRSTVKGNIKMFTLVWGFTEIVYICAACSVVCG